MIKELSNDLEVAMLQLARNIAMDIYPLDKILADLEINEYDFQKIKTHPKFLQYLRAEKEAWAGASNTAERTKLKAGVIIENFLENAYAELTDRKQALNHRIELGKLIAKIAGMGEPKLLNATGSGPAFMLQINIAPGAEPVTIRPEFGKIINYDEPEPEPPPRELTFDTFEPEDDGYDPFTSPNTLEDDDAV